MRAHRTAVAIAVALAAGASPSMFGCTGPYLDVPLESTHQDDTGGKCKDS